VDNDNELIYDIDEMNRITGKTHGFSNAVYETTYTYTPGGLLHTIVDSRFILNSFPVF
jgi:hypothetical protein